MSQEQTLDQYIQQLKKCIKRYYYMLGVLIVSLLVEQFFRPGETNTIIWCLAVLFACEASSQERLVIALKLINGKTVSQP
ncbi:hypothetical protein [uncultured Gimesia sp.]|uniref:hypothetical protein n=1 Tax=uncultured Gimesia sp. TaxID=1678688 RepID=UPI00262A3A2A|nr:hypothetical protein [uncultured Gimesia sp.]